MKRLTYAVPSLNVQYEGISLIRALLHQKDRRAVADESSSNVISSRLASGQHMPVIDLDVPHRLVPSTTEGHGHLYIDVAMPWWRYVILLAALRQAGVIERGFFWWSLRRGATFARLPHVKKDSGTRCLFFTSDLEVA